MSEEEMAVAITFFIAATISITIIALAVLRHQSNKLKFTNQSPGRDFDVRLGRMEQAIDSIAIEVERIAEGQRFTTKLLSDRAAQENARLNAGREG